MSRTLRGAAAIAGVGETTYYKRGQSPDAEFKLALMATIAACEDAGISPKEVDGFASFSNDRSDPSRLANALGIRDLRFSNMQWGGGGGGWFRGVGARCRGGGHWPGRVRGRVPRLGARPVRGASGRGRAARRCRAPLPTPCRMA